jgi:hypothetical protein
MAFVLLRPEHAPKWKDNHDGFASELIRHARTLLPGFACPEWVQIVDELPVSHMQNIHIWLGTYNACRKHLLARSSRPTFAKSLLNCNLNDLILVYCEGCIGTYLCSICQIKGYE